MVWVRLYEQCPIMNCGLWHLREVETTSPYRSHTCWAKHIAPKICRSLLLKKTIAGCHHDGRTAGFVLCHRRTIPALTLIHPSQESQHRNTPLSLFHDYIHSARDWISPGTMCQKRSDIAVVAFFWSSWFQEPEPEGFTRRAEMNVGTA